MYDEMAMITDPEKMYEAWMDTGTATVIFEAMNRDVPIRTVEVAERTWELVTEQDDLFVLMYYVTPNHEVRVGAFGNSPAWMYIAVEYIMQQAYLLVTEGGDAA